MIAVDVFHDAAGAATSCSNCQRCAPLATPLNADAMDAMNGFDSRAMHTFVYVLYWQVRSKLALCHSYLFTYTTDY